MSEIKFYNDTQSPVRIGMMSAAGPHQYRCVKVSDLIQPKTSLDLQPTGCGGATKLNQPCSAGNSSEECSVVAVIQDGKPSKYVKMPSDKHVYITKLLQSVPVAGLTSSHMSKKRIIEIVAGIVGFLLVMMVVFMLVKKYKK